MMEEEMKIGEQEREGLRIETQRLRDELSDLKIEAEIMQDKLRKRQLAAIQTDISAPNSPSMGSPSSNVSSPMIMTPLGSKTTSTGASVTETLTPPSPPMSDASATATTTSRVLMKTPLNPPKSKLKLPSGNSSTTPKPAAQRYPSSSSMRSSRGPAVPTSSARNRNATPSLIRSTKTKAPATRGLPNSTSLTHIRTLTAQMQRLEQRVQSARSKLPAPINTPPRASPRGSSAMAYMPPSVTIRSRKRTGGSTASTSSIGGDGSEDTPVTKHVPRLSTSGISRLSFGPIPNRDSDSRPSSRASATSFVRPDRPLSRSEITRTEIARPASRTSMSGARTPLGHYSQSQFVESRRPRSSIGGSYGAAHGHGHSQSVSGLPDFERDIDGTPSRRGTLPPGETSAIPLPRRQSGGLAMAPMPRRTSSGAALRETETGMKPPGRPRKLSGVGETY